MFVYAKDLFIATRTVWPALMRKGPRVDSQPVVRALAVDARGALALDDQRRIRSHLRVTERESYVLKLAGRCGRRR